MIKKYFKIFEIKKGFDYTHKTFYILKPCFEPLDQEQEKWQCEQVIESMGALGVQYAIVEVWEREPQ